ncbi:hypothetical protein ACFT9M_16265 [Micromonospora purpureochromogenes]|uniref:hypothetical protein n=1 Tax=Micromonospora purpureochromogenes TaxID=47872 RepID=UPI0036388BE6
MTLLLGTNHPHIGTTARRPPPHALVQPSGVAPTSLAKALHGDELVGELAQYEDIYRLCYVRGPEGIIVGLAEQLS